MTPGADPQHTAELRTKALDALLRAAEEARARLAIPKAYALLDRAINAADGPLEHARVLEAKSDVALINYEGDNSWRWSSEAVELRLRAAPDDHLAIAHLCARAVESPTRWPGSMSLTPPETEILRLLNIGREHAGTQDSIPLLQLLIAESFLPFAYGPVRGATPEAVELSREQGIRAEEMAMRLGRPDLASAALGRRNLRFDHPRALRR